ncbi:hypothetical protein PYW07_012066 [Mythimna separata]|uniref:Uncharacterized protein n=1 Tax=Mythimna separata TaxID=271217 RepID=A0AAD7YLF6_MYTSE|nr:hypothetical protein PYW07_012066 [Mythimna separata]
MHKTTVPGSPSHDSHSWNEQKMIFLDSYNPESIASNLVIAFFVTDVILGTLIYYAGGLKINRWLLHSYYCYSLSGSVLTFLLASATMGLSSREWWSLNTTTLNLFIGVLTIMGCLVTIALQVYFVLQLRKQIVERVKNEYAKKTEKVEYPVQINEADSSLIDMQKEKGY